MPSDITSHWPHCWHVCPVCTCMNCHVCWQALFPTHNSRCTRSFQADSGCMTVAWKRTYTNKGFTGNSSAGDSDVHPGGWLLEPTVCSSKQDSLQFENWTMQSSDWIKREWTDSMSVCWELFIYWHKILCKKRSSKHVWPCSVIFLQSVRQEHDSLMEFTFSFKLGGSNY